MKAQYLSKIYISFKLSISKLSMILGMQNKSVERKLLAPN
jgi:hypothetical protein